MGGGRGCIDSFFFLEKKNYFKAKAESEANCCGNSGEVQNGNITGNDKRL